MRQVPPLLLEDIKAEAATLAVCWAIEKKNGQFIRGTEHDENIELQMGSPTDELTGVYLAGAAITTSDVKSGSDMSVDNMEVEGAFQGEVDITDVTVADIEGGLFNRAAVTVFLVNWASPDHGYLILRRGFLGEISRDTDGRYKTEIRGLVQLLSQVIVQTFGERCSVVRLGDAKCKKDISTLTITGTVTSVLNRKRFSVSGITIQPEGYFSLGIMRGLTGANATYEREVKIDNYNGAHGTFELWDAFPEDVEVGDTFAIEPGCNRLITTCISKFNNVKNIRAYGVFIPGTLEMMKGAL